MAIAVKRARATKKNGAKPAPALSLGAVQRVILYVSDFDRAVEFYTKTLGFKAKAVHPGWAELATKGTEIDLHCGRETKAQAGEPNIGFHVDNFDAAYAALLARGVKVGKIFTPCASLRCVNFSDPDGNRLGIEGK